MLNLSLSEIYERNLLQLKYEINLYANESALWSVRGQVSNSAGNLCLHLIGNLNHFIGATLGNTGYVRHRENEFTSKNVPRENLLAEIDKTIEVLKTTLSQMKEEDLAKEFPLLKHDKRVSTEEMLLHLLAHLNYHLGQINYHRRLA
ncbi:MAG: DinB family protein [Bacteroidetes bacterium]|nr:DinB family protein [Bacteroidota bacterium]